MADLERINDQLNTAITALTRLQRTIEKEINASASPPANPGLTADEWAAIQAMRNEQAETASVDAAAQSAALGNPDATTRAKAEEAGKPKTASTTDK